MFISLPLLHFRHLSCMHVWVQQNEQISATIGIHRKMKDFPKPAGRLTKTSLSRNDFHRFPLLGKIVRQFELLFTSSNDNSVIAAGRRVQLCCVFGIHRERNHGSTRSTGPITVHERTAICKSQLEPVVENPGNIAGAEQGVQFRLQRRLDKMQLLANLKNILYMGFRATLNFRKFKVALNPMYRIFLNLPKVASYRAYQMLKFCRAVFEI